MRTSADTAARPCCTRVRSLVTLADTPKPLKIGDNSFYRATLCYSAVAYVRSSCVRPSLCRSVCQTSVFTETAKLTLGSRKQRQPRDSIFWAWSGHVTHFKFEGSVICGNADARVIKFCSNFIIC